MTQYRHPDYHVLLGMSTSDFHDISGIAFDVVVTFGADCRPVTGMLIVPQGNDFCESDPIATAWLWSEDYTTAPEETRVIITLGSACDPMATPEDLLRLKHHSGSTFEGDVLLNWNIEPGAGGDA